MLTRKVRAAICHMVYIQYSINSSIVLILPRDSIAITVLHLPILSPLQKSTSIQMFSRKIYSNSVGSTINRQEPAPYLGLEISKRALKCQKYSLLQYHKNPKVGPNLRARWDAVRFFIHYVENQKVEGRIF